MSILLEKNYQRGFGTYPLRGNAGIKAMETAIATGYRALDTAQLYENESEVGKAITTSSIAREDFCITTKVKPDNYTKELFNSSVEQSLEKLGTSYVDLLLLHWPPTQGTNDEPLELLASAKENGFAKNIGVSNFTSSMMQEAVKANIGPIANNQVEFHPLLNQDILLGASNDTGITLSAYCSVARGEVFKYPLFKEIGEAHSKQPSQVVLRWILQKGVAPITMSTNPDNIRTNYDIMDFELSDQEMALIDELKKANLRVVIKNVANWAPDWD